MPNWRASVLASALMQPLLGHACLGAGVSYSEIARGRYLTDAGDCVACHTAEKGQPFAGGRALETPFGVIYSPNITPDRETGIGAWSDEAFYRAMHLGIDAGGNRLYPAFPYPYFTKLARDDVLAIRAYINTLPAVKSTPPSNQLPWPLNYRVLLRGWNWMFFDAGEYKPDPNKTAEWNRGAYLVGGAAHCGACHTPKNLAGGDKKDARLAGGLLQNWFAPELTDDARKGLGQWSIEDIVEYLKTGRNRLSGATGPMAEVIANSTSKLRYDDLRAIATYLKESPATDSRSPEQPEGSTMTSGEAIFLDSCAACHQANGLGVSHLFPPLAGNANVQSTDPTTVIRVILRGARTVPTRTRPTPSSMPAYNWKLTDAEIAAVANYVRNQWGNRASSVAADRVRSLRDDLQPTAN